MPVDEYDWIFDYVLQFLESEKFDSQVMDFIDENCEVFEDGEENKFIYSDIHRDFRKYLEGLIASCLEEVGISSELFYDACEKGRNSRDINKIVFDRMIAMEDFQTFKKLMVKRNTELQIEALQSIRSFKKPATRIEVDAKDSADSFLEPLPDPEELNAIKEAELEELARQEAILEDEMQALLQESLMEMVLLHRREAYEQAELEEALAMSLALEEERLNQIQADMKDAVESCTVPTRVPSSPPIADSKASSSFSMEGCDIKGSTSSSSSSSSSSKMVASSPMASAKDSPSNSNFNNTHNHDLNNLNNSSSSSSSSSMTPNPLSFPDPKPLKPKGGLKPLPSIGAVRMDLEDRRLAAEQAFRKNQEHLQDQKKLEDDLRKQIAMVSGNANANSISSSSSSSSSSAAAATATDSNESAKFIQEERARHMREQRDRILAQKKKERDQKVREEEEQKAKMKSASGKPEVPIEVRDAIDREEAKKGDDNDSMQEAQRNAMRVALARRMKVDLLDGNDSSSSSQRRKIQDEQFSDLDEQLRKVEKLRTENKQREAVLASNIEKQQTFLSRRMN